MKKLFIVFLIFFTFFNSGCDNSLDIVSEYKEQLAVFLVLDSRSDKHIIKVQKVQKSYGVSSIEKLVDPVSVRIVDPLGYSRTFKDTVINTIPNFNTLYIDSLDLIPGTYQLFVNARDSLHAESSIVVQRKPNYYVTLPTTPDDVADYSHIINISTPLSGVVISVHIKLYMFYTIRQNSEYVEKSVEVPGFVNMLRIPPNPYRIVIPKLVIEKMKYKLMNDFGAENITFSNSVQFVFCTYNTDLYRYVSFYEGFADYSVRLDKPNYTNIVGGIGIFGSAFVDSIWGGATPYSSNLYK
jgi:hypothetical protein